MVSISFCMIVKNEERNVARCLSSIQEIASEMIVVDTGSDDRTKEICLDHGAKVFDLPWERDFSLARNYGLEQATGDWILWMDAEEELIVDCVERLLMDVEREQANLLALPMVHFYGEQPPSQSRSYKSAGYRLFRNGLGIRFTGSIHEHLDLTALFDEMLPPKTVEYAQIKHYGYMDDEVRKKNKSERNLSLLRQQKKASDP